MVSKGDNLVCQYGCFSVWEANRPYGYVLRVFCGDIHINSISPEINNLDGIIAEANQWLIQQQRIVEHLKNGSHDLKLAQEIVKQHTFNNSIELHLVLGRTYVKPFTFVGSEQYEVYILKTDISELTSDQLIGLYTPERRDDVLVFQLKEWMSVLAMSLDEIKRDIENSKQRGEYVKSCIDELIMS